LCACFFAVAGTVNVVTTDCKTHPFQGVGAGARLS
jgi:hypothetical protein